jgi:BMFP domain-containing protein YqiC
LDRIEKQWGEFKLYPPETARALMEERRQFAIRFEKGRNRRSIQELQQRVEALEAQLDGERNKNQRLEGRARNLEGQIQAIQSSRTWRIMTVLNKAKANVAGRIDRSRGKARES